MKGKHQSSEAKQKISYGNKGQKIGFAITSKEMNRRQKKLKTGFYNSKLQSELSKRADKVAGGLAALKKRCKHSWRGNLFYSKDEMNLAKTLIKNNYIKKVKEGINFQVVVGTKQYDFLIKKIFIEFHPFKIDLQGRTQKEYYKERKNNLLQCNIRNKLIVVKSFKDFEHKMANV